jgi:hypothetical protein
MADELDRDKTMNDEMGRGDDDVRDLGEDDEFEDVDEDDTEDDEDLDDTESASDASSD